METIANVDIEEMKCVLKLYGISMKKEQAYLKEAFEFLGEIIGETYSEEILDHLFANFCVGK